MSLHKELIPHTLMGTAQGLPPYHIPLLSQWDERLQASTPQAEPRLLKLHILAKQYDTLQPAEQLDTPYTYLQAPQATLPIMEDALAKTVLACCKDAFLISYVSSRLGGKRQFAPLWATVALRTVWQTGYKEQLSLRLQALLSMMGSLGTWLSEYKAIPTAPNTHFAPLLALRIQDPPRGGDAIRKLWEEEGQHKNKLTEGELLALLSYYPGTYDLELLMELSKKSSKRADSLRPILYSIPESPQVEQLCAQVAQHLTLNADGWHYVPFSKTDLALLSKEFAWKTETTRENRQVQALRQACEHLPLAFWCKHLSRTPKQVCQLLCQDNTPMGTHFSPAKAALHFADADWAKELYPLLPPAQAYTLLPLLPLKDRPLPPTNYPVAQLNMLMNADMLRTWLPAGFTAPFQVPAYLHLPASGLLALPLQQVALWPKKWQQWTYSYLCDLKPSDREGYNIFPLLPLFLSEEPVTSSTPLKLLNKIAEAISPSKPIPLPLQERLTLWNTLNRQLSDLGL